MCKVRRKIEMKSIDELAHEIQNETDALKLGTEEQIRILTDIRTDEIQARQRLIAIRNACKYSRMLAANTWNSFDE